MPLSNVANRRREALCHMGKIQFAAGRQPGDAILHLADSRFHRARNAAWPKLLDQLPLRAIACASVASAHVMGGLPQVQ